MRVLYVCSGNCFRSPAAEALTRLYHPDLEVESAGTNAVDFISDSTLDFLKDHGAIEFVKPEPDQVSERAVEEADLIVAMMPEHREYLLENFDVDDEKIEVWEVKDGIRPDVDPLDPLEDIDKLVQEV